MITNGNIVIMTMIHVKSGAVIVGDTCKTEFQCTHSINNSRCWQAHCSCLPGHRQDIVDEIPQNSTCIPRKLSQCFSFSSWVLAILMHAPVLCTRSVSSFCSSRRNIEPKNRKTIAEKQQLLLIRPVDERVSKFASWHISVDP